MKKIAALDIGGTSIKSGIWTGKEVLFQQEQDTNARNGGLYVMERAKEILHGYGTFDGIGISTAGQVDFEKGCIRYANENIPGYTGMEIRAMLEEEFGVPVAVENDVNAAAIGEAHFGAGAGYDDFLCLTYGTGVGGAIIMNRQLYRGSMYSAGEFGGILIHPEARTAGQPFSGCYEKYASATALTEMAKKVDQSLDNGRKIFARLNEPEIRKIVDLWIDEIVYGLISVIHIFNPGRIVLGGGVMAQPYILEQVREKVNREIMDSFRNVTLETAKLGNQAGLLGAAYLAKKRMEQ